MPSSKIMPHSKETELALLGAMIQDPSFAVNEITSQIADKYFFIEKNKKIFRAVIELFDEAGGAIDMVGLTEKLKRNGDFEFIGGSSFLAELMSQDPILIGLDYYIKKLKDYYFLRKVIASAADIVDRAYQVDENIDAFLSEAEKMFIDISEEQDRKGLLPIKDLLQHSLATLKELSEKKEEITGVPSGIIKFDKLTGGFQPSDLIILAARPAMGKTALALNIASFAAMRHHYAVAVFSLEMAKEQLVYRMLASEARVNSSSLRKGFLTDEDWSKIGAAADRTFNTKMFIDDSADISVAEIRSKCRKLKAENGSLGLIVIDYLQLISSPTKKNDSREREIAEISRSLKSMAKELQCPVIALAQLNRLLETRNDKRPKPSDLRESGSIEQDADLIFFIYRDEVYQPNTDKKGIAELIIGKNRHGGLDTIETAFLPDFTLFQNLHEDEV